MMPSSSKAEKARLFKKRVNVLLSAESKAYLSSCLKGYQAGASIQVLMVSLGRILNKPKKLALLDDIRIFIPSSDLSHYDEEALIWKETGVPPGTSASSSNPQAGGARRKEAVFANVGKTGSLAVIEIQKRKRPAPLGLGLGRADGKVVVTAVVSGSPAEVAGLRQGDLLVTVNGIRVESAGHSDAMTVLASASASTKPIKMVIRPAGIFRADGTADPRAKRVTPPPVLAPQQPARNTSTPDPMASHLRSVTMFSADGVLGMRINGGLGSKVGGPIIITSIEPMSVADGAGLKPGDQIASVNGIDFGAVSHTVAVQVIKSNRHLTLTVRSCPPVPSGFDPESSSRVGVSSRTPNSTAIRNPTYDAAAAKNTNHGNRQHTEQVRAGKRVGRSTVRGPAGTRPQAGNQRQLKLADIEQMLINASADESRSSSRNSQKSRSDSFVGSSRSRCNSRNDSAMLQACQSLPVDDSMSSNSGSARQSSVMLSPRAIKIFAPRVTQGESSVDAMGSDSNSDIYDSNDDDDWGFGELVAGAVRRASQPSATEPPRQKQRQAKPHNQRKKPRDSIKMPTKAPRSKTTRPTNKRSPGRPFAVKPKHLTSTNGQAGAPIDRRAAMPKVSKGPSATHHYQLRTKSVSPRKSKPTYKRMLVRGEHAMLQQSAAAMTTTAVPAQTPISPAAPNFPPPPPPMTTAGSKAKVPSKRNTNTTNKTDGKKSRGKKMAAAGNRRTEQQKQTRQPPTETTAAPPPPPPPPMPDTSRRPTPPTATSKPAKSKKAAVAAPAPPPPPPPPPPPTTTTSATTLVTRTTVRPNSGAKPKKPSPLAHVSSPAEKENSIFSQIKGFKLGELRAAQLTPVNVRRTALGTRNHDVGNELVAAMKGRFALARQLDSPPTSTANSPGAWAASPVN